MRDAQRAAEGVLSRHAVASLLHPLGTRGWRVLDAATLPAEGGDFDHLLIGPAGVFILATRPPPAGRLSIGARTVCAGGHNTPYLRNARREASLAATLLSTAARRVVAVGAAVVLSHESLRRSIAQSGPATEVLTLGLADLPWVFLRARPQIASKAVSELAELVRQPETWRPVTTHPSRQAGTSASAAPRLQLVSALR